MKKPFILSAHRLPLLMTLCAALTTHADATLAATGKAAAPTSATPTVTKETTAVTAEPKLELSFNKNKQVFTRSELLKLPAVRTIIVTDDVSYKKTMTYRAIPLRTLLHDLHDLNGVETVQFKAEDGFVANLPASLLSGAAQPWIAIEPANAPWPPLKEGGRSAGAFYLVWLSPERSHVKQEQWPYQLASISSTSSLQDRYPQIMPDASLPPTGPEFRGLQAYTVHCASCHQVNGGGDANIGPDLNRPVSPTQYFESGYLRKYIRDPASVRAWPQMTMPGFSTAVMDDAQLDDLLAYLRHMASRK